MLQPALSLHGAPARPDADRAVLARVARRYRGLSRFARHYVESKLRLDPAGPALLELGRAEPFGRVVDLGAGYGQFGLALLEGGVAESVVALDRREPALRAATEAAAGLPFEARVADLAAGAALRLPELPACDTVLLIDLLYQLPTAAQAALLEAAGQAAARIVLVRTPDPDDRTRFRFTSLLERVLRLAWPSSGSHVNARPVGWVAGILIGAGFHVTLLPCRQGTPFANVLLVARRRGQ